MSKLGILKVTALSLALAAATPAVVSSADAAYCRSLGAYYDSTSREYMDGTGLWSPCP